MKRFVFLFMLCAFSAPIVGCGGDESTATIPSTGKTSEVEPGEAAKDKAKRQAEMDEKAAKAAAKAAAKK